VISAEGRSEHQGFPGILERGGEGDAAVFAALPVELRWLARRSAVRELRSSAAIKLSFQALR